MKLIALTQGKFAQVDDEDFDYLNQWKWCASKDGNTYHAVRHEYTVIDSTVKPKKYKSRTISMHRLLLNIIDTNQLGDHKDRDGLNNQRFNIRIANHSQNNKNKIACGTSKYLGVSKKHNKSSSLKTPDLVITKWRVAITINKKCKQLGTFPFTPEGEIAAAKLYDQAALKYHGEFANLNFKN